MPASPEQNRNRNQLRSGMVCWDTRYRWLADPKFSARRLEARGQGVELSLVAHDERMAKVFEMALDDAANKPLVDIVRSCREA